MQLNKNDFESALNQDRQKLFAPNPNHQANQHLFGGPNAPPGGEGKSKRELLWEQKRQARDKKVNPPILPSGPP